MWKSKKVKSTNTQNVTISEDFSKSLWNKKIRLLIFASIIVILSLGAGLFFINNENNNQEVSTPEIKPQCIELENDSILARAQAAVTSTEEDKFDKLTPIVDEIKQLPNYEADINCLYPIVYLDMSLTRADEARENHSKIEKLFDEGGQLDEGFLTDRETLKTQIEFLTVLESESHFFNEGPAIDVPE